MTLRQRTDQALFIVTLAGLHYQTHIDVVDDFDQDLVDQLTALAKRHDFMIFEDRKFADIGEWRMAMSPAVLAHVQSSSMDATPCTKGESCH